MKSTVGMFVFLRVMCHTYIQIPYQILRRLQNKDVVGNHGNTYHVADVSRRLVKNGANYSQIMSTFWNVITIFGITMVNALK